MMQDTDRKMSVSQMTLTYDKGHQNRVSRTERKANQTAEQVERRTVQKFYSHTDLKKTP
jgi:hypothetical protein